MLYLKTFIFFLVFQSHALAEVKIAFIQMFDAKGQLVQLEPEGRYGDKYYCSKLVGKLLDIKPLPMSFSADIWRTVVPMKDHGAPAFVTEPGLSPDDIFRELAKTNSRIIRPPLCHKVFLD